MQIQTITTQQPEFYAYLTKWFVGIVLTTLVAVLMYPLRLAYRTAKNVVDTVNEIKAQVNLATTNHLHTIQENTGKTVEILQEMKEANCELIGFLKGRDSR